MRSTFLLSICFLVLVSACDKEKTQQVEESKATTIQPTLTTAKLPHDSDDPAIWIHPTDPSQSLIIGNDKVEQGGIYAFDLKGNIIKEKTISPVARPNNIDIEYGFSMGDSSLDIAVFTERLTESIRVISLPDMQYIDGGGIPVFEGEDSLEFRAPMGVSLYKEPVSKEIYAVVSRKNGPTDGSYLWMYQLISEGDSLVKGKVVRKFGQYVGEGEIEAIMVDDALGYIYYSDEAAGVRKYYAHPDSSNEELALFGTHDFKEDCEGIALWPTSDSTGFIIVSDQQAHTFNVYLREGEIEEPHVHTRKEVWPLSTIETDGCDLYAGRLSDDFPEGIFVAMSEGGTFQVYDLRLFTQNK